jgi:hypothetical protein
VLTAEHFLDFAGLHFLVERFERLAEFDVNRLARRCPLYEDGEVVASLPE